MESERTDVRTEAPLITETSDNKETRLHIIDIVRFAACLMIFLYHCNTILPGEFRFLTFFGEDMGNELFFLISGFALYPSIKNTGIRDFLPWYLKRLKKILPVLVLFYILSYLTGFYSLKDPIQLFTVFIYPTLYWFVTAILVFYILLFFYIKSPEYVRWIIPVVILIIWVLRADKMEGYYLIGGFSMILGAVLRKKTMDQGKRGIPGWITAGTVLSLIFYMVSKYFKFTGKEMMAGAVNMAYVLPGITAVIAGGFILAIGVLAKDSIKEFFTGKEKIYSVIKYAGALALYIYMVQCFNAGIIGYTIGLKVKFPWSFPVNLIIVCGLAALINVLMDLCIGGKNGIR